MSERALEIARVPRVFDQPLSGIKAQEKEGSKERRNTRNSGQTTGPTQGRHGPQCH